MTRKAVSKTHVLPGPMPQGFAVGTRIRTEFGERAIETLSVGDRVITRFGKMATVIASQTHFAPSAKSKAVFVSKGALGIDLPRRDLVLAPGQEVLTQDGYKTALELTRMDGINLIDTHPPVSFVVLSLDGCDVVICSGLRLQVPSFVDSVRMAS